MTVTIDNGNYDFSCTSDMALAEYGGRNLGIPFLSVGAQSNRGNVTATGSTMPVARFRFFNPAGNIDRLRFSAQVPAGHTTFTCSGPKCPSAGHAGYYIGMYLLAEWEGQRRMLFVGLGDKGAMAYPQWGDYGNTAWNWPVSQSFFFPGAEIGHVKVNPGIGLDYCGITLDELKPGNYSAAFQYYLAGVERHYDISIARLFECAYELGTLHWSNNTYNPNVDINVVGIHWFVETIGTYGRIGLKIKNPQITAY